MNEGLRIYDESSARSEPHTLASFFDAYVVPEMEARKEATKLRQYKNSIARFTGFLGHATNTSSIRRIDTISDLDAVLWQQFEVEKGIAATTINVHWTRIRAVLRRAGPPEKGNPKGLAIIGRIPYLQPLTVPRPKPRVVTAATIDALYAYGARDMVWPTKFDSVTPAAAWRAWLVCAYNLAMRTRDLLSLRWDNVHFDPQSLDPDSENESRFGWVEWVPAKTARSKPDPLVLPLNKWVRSHLDSVQSSSGYVFGPDMANVSNARLYGDKRRGGGQWPTLISLASHRTEGGISRFPIKTLRKTANTAYNRLFPKLGAHVLGHAARGVNDMFYQQWEADVIEYVAKLPQPKSFMSPPANSLRQEFLF